MASFQVAEQKDAGQTETEEESEKPGKSSTLALPRWAVVFATSSRENSFRVGSVQYSTGVPARWETAQSYLSGSPNPKRFPLVWFLADVVGYSILLHLYESL